MSTIIHYKKRHARFAKTNYPNYNQSSSSHNTRMVQYKPVLPPGSSKYKNREPKRLKTKSTKSGQKSSNPSKNHQQRLISRIFGREAQKIESQYGINDSNQNSLSLIQSKLNHSRPPLNRKPSNDVSSTNVDSGRDNTQSEVTKPKDFDVKLERALLDLSEHK